MQSWLGVKSIGKCLCGSEIREKIVLLKPKNVPGYQESSHLPLATGECDSVYSKNLGTLDASVHNPTLPSFPLSYNLPTATLGSQL